MKIPNMRCFVIKGFVVFKSNIYSVNLKDIDFLLKPSLNRRKSNFLCSLQRALIIDDISVVFR